MTQYALMGKMARLIEPFLEAFNFDKRCSNIFALELPLQDLEISREIAVNCEILSLCKQANIV